MTSMLLVLQRKYDTLLYRFLDTARYMLTIMKLSCPTYIWRPFEGDYEIFGDKKLVLGC